MLTPEPLATDVGVRCMTSLASKVWLQAANGTIISSRLSRTMASVWRRVSGFRGSPVNAPVRRFSGESIRSASLLRTLKLPTVKSTCPRSLNPSACRGSRAGVETRVHSWRLCYGHSPASSNQPHQRLKPRSGDAPCDTTWCHTRRCEHGCNSRADLVVLRLVRAPSGRQSEDCSCRSLPVQPGAGKNSRAIRKQTSAVICVSRRRRARLPSRLLFVSVVEASHVFRV